MEKSSHPTRPLVPGPFLGCPGCGPQPLQPWNQPQAFGPATSAPGPQSLHLSPHVLQMLPRVRQVDKPCVFSPSFPPPTVSAPGSDLGIVPSAPPKVAQTQLLAIHNFFAPLGLCPGHSVCWGTTLGKLLIVPGPPVRATAMATEYLGRWYCHSVPHHPCIWSSSSGDMGELGGTAAMMGPLQMPGVLWGGAPSCPFCSQHPYPAQQPFSSP